MDDVVRLLVVWNARVVAVESVAQVVPGVLPSQSLHLLHGLRQTGGGVPIISGARARAGTAGDVTCRQGHPLPWQVHPGTVGWEPRVHAEQRTAGPAGPRLQQVAGGLL